MKILIIKPSSFGDIVHANPALAALKRVYPGSNISWLVFDKFQELLELFPDLDNKIVWKRNGGILEFLRITKLIRKEKFDLVIDLQGLFRTGLLSALSGAKVKLGVPGLKEFSWLFLKEAYPKSRSLNAVERNLETVRYLSDQTVNSNFNVSVDDKIKQEAKPLIDSLDLSVNDKLIALVPYSRGLSKTWPANYYRELIGIMLQNLKEVKIVILGSKNDFGSIDDKRVIDLSAKTNFLELAAVLEISSVVVGGDTGPIQLAAALDIPVVVIFGGSDVKETAPVSKKLSILRKDFPCSPCRTRPSCRDHDCLKAIKPEEVFKEINKWL